MKDIFTVGVVRESNHKHWEFTAFFQKLSHVIYGVTHVGQFVLDELFRERAGDASEKDF